MIHYLTGAFLALLLIVLINRGTTDMSKRISPVWAVGSYLTFMFCLYVIGTMVLEYVKISPNWIKFYAWMKGE